MKKILVLLVYLLIVCSSAFGVTAGGGMTALSTAPQVMNFLLLPYNEFEIKNIAGMDVRYYYSLKDIKFNLYRSGFAPIELTPDQAFSITLLPGEYMYGSSAIKYLSATTPPSEVIPTEGENVYASGTFSVRTNVAAQIPTKKIIFNKPVTPQSPINYTRMEMPSITRPIRPPR